ncbi:hypothetical protein ABT104_28515 [Streptomyces mobaraensis]|uniref:hypothetical protein n=1 Tax=Streptomyces mobaraensis TaxID=35621 RepID=UPI0033328139
MAMAGLRHVATVTIASGIVPGGETDPDAIGAGYYADPSAFQALVDRRPRAAPDADNTDGDGTESTNVSRQQGTEGGPTAPRPR